MDGQTEGVNSKKDRIEAHWDGSSELRPNLVKYDGRERVLPGIDPLSSCLPLCLWRFESGSGDLVHAG